MIIGKVEFEKRLAEISKVDITSAVGRGISFVQEAAKSNCPVGDGELRQSIYTDIEDADIVRGTCFPTAAHGPYVEFGTGPKGQAKHDGVSPEVAVAYTLEPWWIHEGPGANEIDRATAEHYHFPHIDTSQGRFYKCTGQAAQPYLYPALKDNEENVLKIMVEEMKKQL